jgi:hypothetical protein
VSLHQQHHAPGRPIHVPLASHHPGNSQPLQATIDTRDGREHRQSPGHPDDSKLTLPRHSVTGQHTTRVIAMQLAELASGTWVRVYRRAMTDRDIWMASVPGASAAAWAAACTLPSVERPLRAAEFDTLFATSLRRVQRLAVTRLLLTFDAGAGAAVRDLTTREGECCSFFTFTVTAVGDELRVAVEVPASYVAVLDALAKRAATARVAT